MNIKLIRAEDEDKVFLLNLREVTMKKYFEEASISLSNSENIARTYSYFGDSYIITYKGKKIGLIKYIVKRESIEIIQFQILPKYQRKGIGTHILNYISRLAEKSHKNIILHVLRNNPAKSLYEQNGFRIIGKDKYEFHMQKMI